jgi:hypothetical protein
MVSPTLASEPTNTPMPTDISVFPQTPAEAIEGIDIPITIVPKNWTTAVKFKFFSASISTNPTTINGVTLTPGNGQSILVVHAYFTGDLAAFFGTLDKGSSFWIEDQSLLYPGWEQYQLHDNVLDMAFVVQTGAEPYQLGVLYFDQWTIDLTRLMDE